MPLLGWPLVKPAVGTVGRTSARFLPTARPRSGASRRSSSWVTAGADCTLIAPPGSLRRQSQEADQVRVRWCDAVFPQPGIHPVETHHPVLDVLPGAGADAVDPTATHVQNVPDYIYEAGLAAQRAYDLLHNQLGFDLPLRLSGDIKGTLGCMLMGPAGFFEMQEGVIRALRHVHMSPDDAAFYGVKPGDEMKLKIGGPCGIALEKMLVRRDKSFKLEVHIDTDEGNACNLQPGTPCELTK